MSADYDKVVTSKPFLTEIAHHGFVDEVMDEKVRSDQAMPLGSLGSTYADYVDDCVQEDPRAAGEDVSRWTRKRRLSQTEFEAVQVARTHTRSLARSHARTLARTHHAHTHAHSPPLSPCVQEADWECIQKARKGEARRRCMREDLPSLHNAWDSYERDGHGIPMYVVLQHDYLLAAEPDPVVARHFGETGEVDIKRRTSLASAMKRYIAHCEQRHEERVARTGRRTRDYPTPVVLRMERMMRAFGDTRTEWNRSTQCEDAWRGIVHRGTARRRDASYA